MNKQESYISADIVRKKIKAAGWSIRLIGIAAVLLFIAFLLTSQDPRLLLVLAIGLISFFAGHNLYKASVPVNQANSILKAMVVVLFPTIFGLFGIIVMTYIFSALNAIKKFKKQERQLVGTGPDICPSCGCRCDARKQVKCKECDEMFWRSKEALDAYNKKHS